MTANVVYLDPAGLPANPAERMTDVISVLGTMQVGTTVGVKVTVQNQGPDICNSVSVLFSYKGPGQAHPTAIPLGECPSGNPVGPTSLDVNQTATFTLLWTIQSTEAGAGTVYTQIQQPGIANPLLDDMSRPVNAERNVFIAQAPSAERREKKPRHHEPPYAPVGE